MKTKLSFTLLSLCLSAILSAGSITSAENDESLKKTSGTTACCTGLISGGSAGTMSKSTTMDLSSLASSSTSASTSGTGTSSSVSASGAGGYFSDSSISIGAGVYGYNSVGAGSWTVPTGVTKLSAVIVGPGGFGGATGSSPGVAGAGGGGAGFIKGLITQATEGGKISWSISADKTCFSGVCADKGLNGGSFSGKNGGAGGRGSSGGGGGASVVLTSGLKSSNWSVGSPGTGGNGFGYGTSFSNGANGAAGKSLGALNAVYATAGSGGIRGGAGGKGGSTDRGAGGAGGLGAGLYSSTITSSISGKRLTDNTFVQFPMPATGYGYGGSGDGVCISMKGLVCVSRALTPGGNGAIFIWAE